MQIHYAGKVSKAEFLQALFTHSNKQYRVYKWFIGSVIVMIAFSAVYLMSYGSSELADAVKYALPGGLIPLVAMTFPWWSPYLQVSAYDQKGNIYRNNVFGIINEHEITINGGDMKISIQWKAFTKCELSNNILLLFQGKNCFNIFTRGMFSNQSEWEGFISLIKTKLSANQGSA